MTVAIIAAETVVLALLTILVAGLLRSHADILRRLHALDGGLEETNEATIDLSPTRKRAADVTGTGLGDDALLVPVSGVQYRTVLAFLSSGCLTCRMFWDAFADPAELDLPPDVRLVVVAKDAHEESITALRELAPSDVPFVLSSATWEAYDVPGSPYFVLIDGAAGRVVGEGTGQSWEQVRRLMLQATGDSDDNEVRIDRELIAYGVEPGDPSLYRTAEELSGDIRS